MGRAEEGEVLSETVDAPTVRSSHDEAMELYHQGIETLKLAVQKELQAIELLADTGEKGTVTRGVLYSSAAWMAINAGQPKQALELAEKGSKENTHHHAIHRLNEAIHLANCWIGLMDD